MSCFGIGGLTSIGGGWLGDRFSAKALLSISFFIASIIGYLLFHAITGFVALAAAQIVWGAVGGGTLVRQCRHLFHQGGTVAARRAAPRACS